MELTFNQRRIALRWVEMQCTLPLIERLGVVFDTIGRNRSVVDQTLAISRELQADWLGEVHGDVSRLHGSECDLSRRWSDWQTMLVKVFESLKKLDPMFLAQSPGLQPWNTEPALAV